jgi:hypothetical protein
MKIVIQNFIKVHFLLPLSPGNRGLDSVGVNLWTMYIWTQLYVWTLCIYRCSLCMNTVYVCFPILSLLDDGAEDMSEMCCCLLVSQKIL